MKSITEPRHAALTRKATKPLDGDIALSLLSETALTFIQSQILSSENNLNSDILSHCMKLNKF